MKFTATEIKIARINLITASKKYNFQDFQVAGTNRHGRGLKRRKKDASNNHGLRNDNHVTRYRDIPPTRNYVGFVIIFGPVFYITYSFLPNR